MSFSLWLVSVARWEGVRSGSQNRIFWKYKEASNSVLSWLDVLRYHLASTMVECRYETWFPIAVWLSSTSLYSRLNVRKFCTETLSPLFDGPFLKLFHSSAGSFVGQLVLYRWITFKTVPKSISFLGCKPISVPNPRLISSLKRSCSSVSVSGIACVLTSPERMESHTTFSRALRKPCQQTLFQPQMVLASASSLVAFRLVMLNMPSWSEELFLYYGN